MGAAEVRAIADQIKALPPAAQLRLAADMIENHMLRTAKPIVDHVAGELAIICAALPTGSKAP